MNANYHCLSRTNYHAGEYQLVSVRPQDIQLIRCWRNAQIDVLRQDREITSQEQERYFEKQIWPTLNHEQPTQILFSFLREQQPVGYGGLVHINWSARKSEVSVLFDLAKRSEDLYREQLSAYLTLLKDVAFSDLGMHRLWTESYDIRPLHISILADQGFEFEGRLRDHEWINGRYVDTLFHACLNDSCPDTEVRN